MSDIPVQIATVAWNPSWNFQFIKLLLLTVVFITGIVLLLVYGNVSEISNNFAKYRCNPAVMPFAGLFGQNASDNFSFCMKQLLNGQASSIFAPIYTILGNFLAIMTTMSNALMSVRTMFANFYGGVNNFIATFQRRIQSLMLQIRLSFIKMQNLMGRVYGTMYATTFMGVSAITAGTNLGDNSLVKFIFATAPCFAPDTPIRMADGSRKAIKDIQLGDFLSAVENGNKKGIVTSVFRFDGSKTPMVTIGSYIISTTHYVQYEGKWIQACQHPSALPTKSISDIICLSVEGNQFLLDDARTPLRVADYRESSDPSVLAEAQIIADFALNGSNENEYIKDYTFGITSELEVALADGRWKRSDMVVIGDVLEGSGRVYGLVHEACQGVASLFGPAQFIWSAADAKWRRAATLFHVQNAPVILYSFFTEGCSTIRVRSESDEYFIRDYAEVPIPEMEAPFENALAIRRE